MRTLAMHLQLSHVKKAVPRELNAVLSRGRMPTKTPHGLGLSPVRGCPHGYAGDVFYSGGAVGDGGELMRRVLRVGRI